jgi:acyl dehydratase
MSSPEIRTVEATSSGLAGVAGLARNALRRKRGGPKLPAVEYRSGARHPDGVMLPGYQRLCGFAITSTVPSTFVHVQAFPLATALMGAADFPLPLLGLVHVHNRITQLRPIDAAETLDLRVWADHLGDHPAGRQFDIEAEATVAGEAVWRGTSTYLHRTVKAAATSTTATAGGRADTPAPPPPVAFWRLPADLGRRYAGVSGDRNPIHLSKLTAKGFGFPAAIAHGMWLNARVLGALEPRLAAAYTVDVAFKTPAFLPSAVAFAAQRTDAGWQLDVRNARNGKPHLTATITAA